jgi:hypothetical protein
VMHERLQNIGAKHVTIEITSQSTPCPTLRLERVPSYSQSTLL